MALIKQKELDTGQVVEYWKISIINSRTKPNMEITLDVFIDARCRVAGKPPVETVRKVISFPDDLEMGGNLFSYCYDKLKLLPEFLGATDV